MKKLLFLSLCSVLFLAGCSVNKRLAPYATTLEKAANANISPDEKLEILANSINSAMTESLVFVNPKKTVQFIDRFSSQNDKSITKILADMDAHVKKMGFAGKVQFFAETSRKPYIQEFKQTSQKVEKKVGRKIKTFALVGKVLGFLNPLKN